MDEPRNIRLTIEYDGRQFHGWQRQPRLRTVQSELETALATILRHPVTLYGAGRTDAGVHAIGQVANFRTQNPLSIERLCAGSNALTGRDIVVADAREVADDFHARFSACGRHYVYLLLERPSALWVGRAARVRAPLNLELLNTAAAHLVGSHDFAAFSCRSEDQERTDSRLFYARWERWPRGLALRIAGMRFLYKMVRCVVGRSLEVSAGKQSPDSFGALLAEPPERGRAIAPAGGLYLAQVDYDPAAAARWGPDCLPPWPVL